MIYLDTHVVVWMYSGKKELFSKKSIELIEKEDLLISPMVSLELEYLYETGKISASASDILDDLRNKIGLTVCEESFLAVISQSIKYSWTRDPFDRIIVGHAALKSSKLISKDAQINKNYPKAAW